MSRIIRIIIAVALIGASVPVSSPAQGSKDDVRVLFVGNSYTYVENLPHVVSVLSEKTGTKLVTEKVTLGGAKLSEHWRGARDLDTRERIHEGDYDIVVLQEWSLGTVNEKDSTMKYLALFSDYIREEGAKPYYFLTWARERVPQQQEAISVAYREAAIQNDATIVPVGEAWAIARKLRPDFRLFYPDGTHPSELGTYLTACVFVAVLTGELPENLPSVITINDSHDESVILMMIDAFDVAFCREVALEAAGVQGKSVRATRQQE